ncbi:hypothetical protein D3C85_847490 [compost metagenome]
MDQERLHQHFFELFFSRNYRGALPLGKMLAHLSPRSGSVIGNLATCHLMLGENETALKLYQRAHVLDPREMNVLDGLTHVCGNLGLMDQVRQYGRQSLALKDALFRVNDLPPLLPQEVSPAGGRDLFAFSLYGDSPRYCETAILNVEAAQRLLPGWVCRFYVDTSVPAAVLDRLRAGGAEVVPVDEEAHRCIPGLMWRFLALENRDVRRVSFRDADSLIGERECEPIGQWLASERLFHVMRDGYTHSELILAGMWGAVAWPLRDIRQRMLAYLAGGGHPTHVDQHFLREKIWPLAKQSMISHDSVFGFSDALPMPPREVGGLGVGMDYGSREMSAPCDLPDGSLLEWAIVERATRRLVCAYRVRVQGGRWASRVPLSLGDALRDGRYEVRVSPLDAPAETAVS